MILPPYLTHVKGPSSSAQTSGSVSYDYSGMDDRAKKLDAIEQLRPAKYQALYNGDVAASTTIEQRIRDLVGAVANPRIPMVRVASSQRSTSTSGDSGEIRGDHLKAAPEPDYEEVAPPKGKDGKTKDDEAKG